MRQPEQRDSFIAIVIRVDQQDHICLSNLAGQVVSLVREGRSVDNGRGSYIFRGANGRRDGDLRQNGLDLVGDEYTLHQRGDEARLARALVPTDTDSHWGIKMVSFRLHTVECATNL